MSIAHLSAAQLRKAASIVERIEKLQHKLNSLHGTHSHDGHDGAPVVKPGRKRRRKISAAGIARIRAAQKLRWAKVHAARKGK